MLSHTKCKIDWTSTTYFLFRVSEDTGYTVRQQQSIKYRKKTFAGPSKTTEEKEKANKKLMTTLAVAF